MNEDQDEAFLFRHSDMLSMYRVVPGVGLEESHS